MLAFGPALGEPRLTLTPFGFLGLTSLACGLVLLDARASGEDVLLANAGVSRPRLVLVTAALVSALELLVHIVWS